MNIANRHITSNSQKVRPNSVFIYKSNKKAYLEEALRRGATTIISDKMLNVNVKTIVVKDLVEYEAQIYKNYYEIEMNDFIIIGITGTDGKTTTAKIIYDSIITRYQAAYIGTLGIILNHKITESQNTTPDLETIYETLYLAKKAKAKYIVMEVSSEGLLAKRLLGIKFDYTIFTNLSREHLNTHKTLEEYFLTKCTLFNQLKENGKIITNIEDAYGKIISQKYNTITYGIHKGDAHLFGAKLTSTYSKLIIYYDNHFYFYQTNLLCSYNLYNFLAAFIVINQLFGPLFLSNKLSYQINGRFVHYKTPKIEAIIDFAHTPNGLANLLLSIKELFAKKIILVIGSQGGKDHGKRKMLGVVADQYAEEIIITSEDPKAEPVINIISDIAQGIKRHTYRINIFRKAAIKEAISLYNSDSIIVIVGKGNEKYEEINNIKYCHSDLDSLIKYAQ